MSSKDGGAPDGGWGWLVLLAAHSTLIFREGIAKCLGVFLPTFRDYFDTSTSFIGWISSFCITTADLTGLISGPACQRFGCRPVAVIGGVFAGLGLILSASVRSIYFLCVCLALSGFGLGLALTPSITMISCYFDKHYSLANGLAYAGSGVGILILAPLAQFLLDLYGWRGALLNLGALCLNVSVCGTLLRPLRTSGHTKTEQYKPLVSSDEESEHSQNGYASHEQNVEAADDKKKYKTSRWQKVKKSLALSLFTNVSFLILLVVQFCSRFTYMGWLIYLVPHAIQKGIQPMDAALVASAGGVSNIVARSLHGLLIDSGFISALQLLIIASILAFASLTLDPFLYNLSLLVIGSLVYGLASGVIFPACVVRMREVTGTEKLANALGWSYGFAGFGRMAAAFITGWFFDVFGDYKISFIVLGSVQLLAAILLIIDFAGTKMLAYIRHRS